jgi:hypothetical protein
MNKKKDLYEIFSDFFKNMMRDTVILIFCILVLVGLITNVILTVSLKIDIQELRKAIITNQK